MKSTLIAAIVLLALAQGSFATEATDLEKMTQFFEDLKNKMTRDVTEFLRTQEVAAQAQSFVESKRETLEPLAAQIQEQMLAASTKVQEQLAPLAANVQAQIQPLMANFQRQVEALLQKVNEQTHALGN